MTSIAKWSCINICVNALFQNGAMTTILIYFGTFETTDDFLTPNNVIKSLWAQFFLHLAKPCGRYPTSILNMPFLGAWPANRLQKVEALTLLWIISVNDSGIILILTSEIIGKQIDFIKNCLEPVTLVSIFSNQSFSTNWSRPRFSPIKINYLHLKSRLFQNLWVDYLPPNTDFFLLFSWSALFLHF